MNAQWERSRLLTVHRDRRFLPIADALNSRSRPYARPAPTTMQAAHRELRLVHDAGRVPDVVE